MDRLADGKYVKRNVDKNWLIKNNFKYSSILSDENEDIYTYRFPVYKNGGFTILECEIAVCLNTGDTNIDVFEYGTRDRYAPFYYVEYGNYDSMLKSINDCINPELKKLGINKKKGK